MPCVKLWTFASLAVVLWASSVRADDWLAVLPDCAASPGGSGQRAHEPTIVYPRAGLPAVVQAGHRLVVRVQLPVPLTPPPGVQQSRALQQYSAELRATTPPLEPAGSVPTGSVTHRYPMEVIAVRPDGASSLRYRVTLPVPAWAAPGAYELRLVAAGVALAGPAPVVVLAQGAAPRVQALSLRAEDEADESTPEVEHALQAGVRAPVDVWLLEAAAAGDAPSHHLGSPVLDPRALVAALRVGEGLIVLGDCAGPHLSFADEVAAVLATEHRARLAEMPLVDRSTHATDARRSPRVLQLHCQLNRSMSAAGFTLHARAEQALELSFVLPADGRALRASAGALELYPAGELPAPGKSPTLVARWQLQAGADAELTRPAAKLALPAVAIELRPSPLPSGQPLRVRAGLLAGVPARGGGKQPAPQLALRFDERSTAFGTGEASHSRFSALGTAQVRALLILPDGRAQARTERVQVVTAAAIGCGGCSAWPRSAAQGGRGGGFGLALSLWCAAWLLKRRPPRARGNRLCARSRSPDQPRKPAPLHSNRSPREAHPLAHSRCPPLPRRALPRRSGPSRGLRPQADPEHARRRHRGKPRSHRFR